MLLTKDSVGKADKDKGIIPINAKILEYTKEFNGKEVKQFIPLNKTFEYEVDLTNRTLVEKVVEKVFKVKKGVTEITFEGDFVEGGALVTVTEDDIPQDIKDLIEIGAYTLEEALTKCTENSGKERRMILRKPAIKMVGDEGSKTPQIQKFDNKYTDEDLILDFMFEDNSKDTNDNDTETDENISTSSDDDWLNNL
jgi:hypothetical protein